MQAVIASCGNFPFAQARHAAVPAGFVLPSSQPTHGALTAYETGTAGVDLGCTLCIDQTNCAVSTANTCSTTSTFTTKTICTSVTANGFYLDGDPIYRSYLPF